MIPAKSPSRQFLLKKRPTRKGVKMTKAPGASILFSDALVEMATHLSGSASFPFFISLNYSLISLIISLAASPTADIVKAEKAYGIIAPINNPAKVVGSKTLTTNDPYSRSELVSIREI